MTSDSDPMLGRVLGPYRILRQLGQGAMGVVYAADESALDRLVAVKLLRPELARDQEIAQKFLQEARLSAKLEHPHIVRIYASGKQDEIFFFAMQYVRGESLADRIEKQGKMSPRTAIDLLLPIAEALSYAHQKGLIHRDIKPGNIMISRDETPLLTDFGLALRCIGTVAPQLIEGTPEYLSPEQAAGGALDYRTDLYSFAVMLYKLVTGVVPHERFKQLEMQDYLQAVMDEPAVPMDEVVRDLPTELTEFTMRLLAKDPQARAQTTTELVVAIKKLSKAPSIDILTRAGILAAQKQAEEFVEVEGSGAQLPGEDLWGHLVDFLKTYPKLAFLILMGMFGALLSLLLL